MPSNGWSMCIWRTIISELTSLLIHVINCIIIRIFICSPSCHFWVPWTSQGEFWSSLTGRNPLVHQKWLKWKEKQRAVNCLPTAFILKFPKSFDICMIQDLGTSPWVGLEDGDASIRTHFSRSTLRPKSISRLRVLLCQRVWVDCRQPVVENSACGCPGASDWLVLHHERMWKLKWEDSQNLPVYESMPPSGTRQIVQRQYSETPFHSEIQMSCTQNWNSPSFSQEDSSCKTLGLSEKKKLCCLFLPRRLSFLHHKQSSVARVRSGVQATVKAVQRMDGWISRASSGETTMGRALLNTSGWCCNWIPNDFCLGTTGSIISDTAAVIWSAVILRSHKIAPLLHFWHQQRSLYKPCGLFWLELV